MDKIEKIDCTTCKYGYEDEQLGIPMCHHPKRFSEDCIDFNMHEEKPKFNVDKLQKVAKPATPYKKPMPEDKEKYMEELHKYSESKKPDKNLDGPASQGIPGKDFIPVEWVDACERYGKWEIVRKCD